MSIEKSPELGCQVALQNKDTFCNLLLDILAKYTNVALVTTKGEDDMRWMYPIVILAAFMLLSGNSCNEPIPEKVFCVINANGRGFKEDNSLQIANLGRAFYVSDDLIFHLGERLVKHGIGSSVTTLSPEDMPITDTQYLAIDQQNSRLYFAAKFAICRVGFDGQDYRRISPDDNGYYSAPALSSDGNYLTAIRNGQIARMDIQTEEWTVLPEPVTARYAIFTEDTQEYYYFSSYLDYYIPTQALCKLDAQQDSTLIFTAFDSDFSHYYNAKVSSNFRYFASHNMKEPTEDIDYFGSSFTRYPAPLSVHDRQTGESFIVPDCFTYTFDPGGDAIIYSRLKYGMADLMRMDLSTRQSTMIWDGYHKANVFSYSVSEIFPRFDGQLMYLQAWKRVWRTDDDKSSTAPRHENYPLPSGAISPR